MRWIAVGVMCVMPWVLVGCGNKDGAVENDKTGVGGSAQSDPEGQAALEINWGPEVDMAMRQRIGMSLTLMEELSRVFSPEGHSGFAEAQRAAAALRTETTTENMEALEAAVNAFSETLGVEDEEKFKSAGLEAMSRQFEQAMLDFMVHALESLMTELVLAFPPSEYPDFRAFQRVANSLLAKPSTEGGERFEDAMNTFKASLSEADAQRFEEIEEAVKLAEAQLATDQGNEMALKRWLEAAEEQRDSIWVTPGALIPKVAFNELAKGMSYDDAVAILEREGDSMGRGTGTFNGVSSTTEVFQWAWEKSDGTWGKIETYFLNDELNAKVYFNDIP